MGKYWGRCGEVCWEVGSVGVGVGGGEVLGAVWKVCWVEMKKDVGKCRGRHEKP